MDCVSPNPTDLVHDSAPLSHCHLQVQEEMVAPPTCGTSGTVRAWSGRWHYRPPGWVSDHGEETESSSPGLSRALLWKKRKEAASKS